MRHQYAPIVYNFYYIVSIGYTMAATKLSLNQCNPIQSPNICVTLNKMGINRNVSHNIVFGPKSLGGLEMHPLYTLQGTKCLQYLLGHIAWSDRNGNLMRICMEHKQLEVGTYCQYSITRRNKYDLYKLCYAIGDTGIRGNTKKTDTPPRLWNGGLEAKKNRVTVISEK
jgi:hypothetical protein